MGLRHSRSGDPAERLQTARCRRTGGRPLRWHGPLPRLLATGRSGFIVVNVVELRGGDGLHTCKNALTGSNTSLLDTGSPPPSFLCLKV